MEGCPYIRGPLYGGSSINKKCRGRGSGYKLEQNISENSIEHEVPVERYHIYTTTDIAKKLSEREVRLARLEL
jgi:hypothetical protein